MTTIELFDPARILKGIGDPSPDGYVGPEDERPVGGDRVSVEEEQWRRTLREIAWDPRGPTRPVLRGSGDTWCDLAGLDAIMPHFGAVTEMLQRSNEASMRSQTRVRFAPLLLLGLPGIGKTFYARRVAQALKTSCVEIAMNLANDRGRLSGYSMAWRGARMGDIAKGALAAPTSAPLFFIDEIDKTDERERCHDVLLSLLEPENAATFTDEYLTACATLRLDHALWIATANDVSRIPEPVLDRMLVVNVEAPTGSALKAVIESIHLACAADYGARFASRPTPEVMAILEGVSPRVLKRILELAIQSAIAAHRWSVSLDDIEIARELVRSRPQRHQIGFGIPL